MQSMPFFGIIAISVTFVITLGEIDLSAGYAAGVSGAVLVILITNHQVPWYIAFPISIVVGGLLEKGMLRAGDFVDEDQEFLVLMQQR